MAPFTLMRATFSALAADASASDTRIAKIHRWQFIASALYHAESRLQRIGSDCYAASSRRISARQLPRAMINYASKIEKTANGGRSCACRQARRDKKVIAPRRFPTNGQVDEQ